MVWGNDDFFGGMFDFNGDGVYDASGYISGIYELSDTTMSNNLISSNQVILENGTHYKVIVMVTMGGATMPSPTEFYFWHDCCGC